jgi:hypothetical protein
MSFTGQSENPDSMQVPLIRGCGCVPLPGLSSSVNIDFVLFFKRKKKRQGGKGKGNWLDKAYRKDESVWQMYVSPGDPASWLLDQREKQSA